MRVTLLVLTFSIAVSSLTLLAQSQGSQNSSTSSHIVLRENVTDFPRTSRCKPITFSEFPVSNRISTHYKNWGIVFGGNGPFITKDGSNPNSPVLSVMPQFQGAIEGNFEVRDKPPFVVGFEIDAGYFDRVGSTRLSWYNRNGKLLGQQTNTGLGIQRFSVFPTLKNIEPIAKWRLEPVGNDPSGFAIDNVCFQPAYAVSFAVFGRYENGNSPDINQLDLDRPNVRVIPLYPLEDELLNPSTTDSVP